MKFPSFLSVLPFVFSAWTAQAAGVLQNFGEIHLKEVAQKLSALEKKEDTVLRITQFGDSHTAADTMTHALRTFFQAKYGDAGIGWVSPMPVYGQRNALTTLNANKGWTLSNSRFQQESFPMGGYIARAMLPYDPLSVMPRRYSNELWKVKFWVRQPNANTKPLMILESSGEKVPLLDPAGTGQWVQRVFKMRFDRALQVTATQTPAVELGGIELERFAPGVIVSSIGSNGARQSLWKSWQAGLAEPLRASQSDVVILAYGTNEAFDSNLEIEAYTKQLRASIQQIRAALPNAAVLLLGAPDAIQKKGGVTSANCSVSRPAQLSAVQLAQRQVAQSEKTLLWHWHLAMGGDCSMPLWIQSQLARPDGVHFSQAGYERLAQILFNDLEAEIKSTQP